MELLQKQLECQQMGRPYALCTIVDTTGTTARKSGSSMLVFPDGSIMGSVGGSLHEQAVIADALNCIRTGSNLLKEYSTIADLKPGENPAYIHVFIQCPTAPPHLVISGAGHVGAAVLKVAKFAGFSVTMVDDRESILMSDKLKDADRRILVKDYYTDILNLDVPDNASYMLCSWGHDFDGDALKAILSRPHGYAGMIGGKPKIQSIFTMLRNAGISEEALQTVYTPIGLNIGGQTPEHIAIGVIAQIMAYLNDTPLAKK